MKKFLNAIVGAAFALSSTSALAAATVADVTSANGKVLVDMGKGFAPVDGLVSLKVGDKVFVGAESAAQVDFKSGCAVTVGASSTFVVGKVAPCSKGEMTAVVGKNLLAPASDVVAAEDPNYVAAAAPAAALLPLLLIGGGALAVTSYAIVKSNNDNGGGSASDE